MFTVTEEYVVPVKSLDVDKRSVYATVPDTVSVEAPQLKTIIAAPVVKLFNGDVKTGTVGGSVSTITDHVGAQPELLPMLLQEFTLQYHLLEARAIMADAFAVKDE